MNHPKKPLTATRRLAIEELDARGFAHLSRGRSDRARRAFRAADRLHFAAVRHAFRRAHCAA